MTADDDRSILSLFIETRRRDRVQSQRIKRLRKAIRDQNVCINRLKVVGLKALALPKVKRPYPVNIEGVMDDLHQAGIIR